MVVVMVSPDHEVTVKGAGGGVKFKSWVGGIEFLDDASQVDGKTTTAAEAHLPQRFTAALKGPLFHGGANVRGVQAPW